jgi:hypothetical protein
MSRQDPPYSLSSPSVSSQEKADVRTSLSIRDHDSKFGTWLDGTDIKNQTVNATMNSHALQLAKMPEVLRCFGLKFRF